MKTYQVKVDGSRIGVYLSTIVLLNILFYADFITVFEKVFSPLISLLVLGVTELVGLGLIYMITENWFEMMTTKDKYKSKHFMQFGIYLVLGIVAYLVGTYALGLQTKLPTIPYYSISLTSIGGAFWGFGIAENIKQNSIAPGLVKVPKTVVAAANGNGKSRFSKLFAK